LSSEQTIKGKDCHLRKILPLKIEVARDKTIDSVCISFVLPGSRIFIILIYFNYIKSLA